MTHLREWQRYQIAAKLESGQEVQKNEIIARLKVIPDMGSLSSAQSRLRLSELNLKQAQVNYGRHGRQHEGPHL